MTQKTKHIAIEDEIIRIVGRTADLNKYKAYVVGGYVRDKLLGQEVKDIDFTIIGNGIAFADLVAKELGSQNVIRFEKFGTAMIPLQDRNLEFVSARQERYESDSRKPKVKKSTIDADLARRDFTINTP